VKNIDPIKLREKLLHQEDIQLIDIRQAWEHEAYNIGGILIEPDTLFEKKDLIDRSKPVVFYCSKGIRSQIAIQRLQQKFHFNNLYNLSGGIEAWRKMVG
jgi:rhodanese-related sulfurtransferase